MSTTLFTALLPSPLGDMRGVWSGAGTLVFLDFADNENRIAALLKKRFGVVTLEDFAAPNQDRVALESYFLGDLDALRGVAVDTGGTDFQQRVWLALREIPAGATWSYSRLAAHLGQPGAVRAVGATNALNPVALVLPCHRVIGANGALTGYAGGLQRKAWLLAHEGASVNTTQNVLFA